MGEQVQGGRVDQARRAVIRNRLTGRAWIPTSPERWCDPWEAEAVLQGLARNEDYWDAGKLWVDAHCAARKRPPS